MRDVGLLIGYDCSRALDPKEVISAPEGVDGPFGLRTELGWGLVGVISGKQEDSDGHCWFQPPNCY